MACLLVLLLEATSRSAAPQALAYAAANVTTTTATLAAEVSTGNEPCTVFFIYNGVTRQVAVPANGSGVVSINVTGLAPGTYHQQDTQVSNATDVHNSYQISFVTRSVFSGVAERKSVVTYASPSSGFDRHDAVVSDTAGNIYVAGLGEAAQQLGVPAPGFPEDSLGKAYVSKRNATGAVTWERVFNALGGRSYEARHVAVHTNGDVAITGFFINSAGNADYFTAKYSSAGTLQWSRAYNGSAAMDDYGERVAFDSAGNVIVTGKTELDDDGLGYFAITTLKYPATGGNPTWTRLYRSPVFEGEAYPTDLVVNSTNDVFVAGVSAEGDGDSWYLARYRGTDGLVRWTAPKTDSPDENNRALALALAPNGDVAVTGEGYNFTSASHRLWTRVYDPANGAARWEVFDQFSAAGYAITFDSAGNVIVAGTRNRTLSFGFGDEPAPLDFYVRKMRGSNGGFVWSREWSGSEEDDVATAIRVDGAGHLIVAGTSKSSRSADQVRQIRESFAAVKCDGATGNLMWEIRAPDPFATGVAGPLAPRGLSLTSDGGVFLAGSDFAGTDRNGVLEKYFQVALPSATTNAATAMTATTAQLNGSALANNGRTDVRFEWGLTTGYGNTTPLVDIGNTDVSAPHQAPISGLLPNRTYHFRMVATNAAGSTLGVDQLFTTLRSAQTITFPALPTRSLGDLPFDLLASATSGAPVTFAATVGGEKIQLSGDRVTILAGASPGLITLRASAAQTQNFLAAPDVFRSFFILGGNASFNPFGVGAAAGASSRALGVSNGGLTVVGARNDGAGDRPARWTPSLTSPLFDLSGGTDEGSASAISGDGASVAGHSRTGAGLEIAVLRGAGPVISLGDLAGGITDARATALTPDGVVVVGFGTTATVDQAVRWTSLGVLVNLGALSSGGRSTALGLSADGGFVVGRSQSPNSGAGFEPFVWTAEGGMVGLGSLGTAPFSGAATAVSADGNVIVGVSNTAGGSVAFRKDGAGPLASLDDLSGGALASTANAISADGHLIVGFGTTATTREATLWETGQPVRALRDVLASDYGLPNAFAGWTNTEATAISPDGFAIAGFGTNPQGKVEAWMVRLPRKSIFTLPLTAVSFSESAGVVQVAITKTTGFRDVVSFQIAGETAIPVVDGVGDFIGGDGEVVFDTYETSKTVSLMINNDAAVESTESLRIVLVSTAGGSRILNLTTRLTILDNDVAGPGQPLALAPGTPPTGVASLQVNLTPAGARWRLQGETAWRGSGSMGIASGLLISTDAARPSEYVIEFEPNGGSVPEPQIVTIAVAGPKLVDVAYPPTAVAQGQLRVRLEPSELNSRQVVSERAGWRLLGETGPFSGMLDPAWRESGQVLDLPAGTYVIEFKPLAGRGRLLNRNVLIQPPAVPGDRTEVIATYRFIAPSVGALPTVLSQAQATVADESTPEPFAFAGQIQSDVGEGSGFAVKERVVLTAGHIVFDDFKLSSIPDAIVEPHPTDPRQLGNLARFATTGLRWRHQRMRGISEPVPLTPRGSYALRGYAAARRGADPGVGTPESQELDVAALYFNVPVARGGHGGFLVSDPAGREWMRADRRKTFVSYPTDADRVPEPENRGRMHATPTPPALIAFTKPYGEVSNVYRTTAIAGVPGSSGGPLCVQWDDGRYYAAGVYVGGSGEAIFREIDADVAEIIRRADESSRGGPNNHNGGSIQVSNGSSDGSFTVARLTVTLRGPDGAAPPGAQWRINARELKNSGESEALPLTRGDFAYMLTFTDVPGFIRPANVPLRVPTDDPLTLTRVYRPMVIASFSGLVRGASATIGGVGSVRVSLVRGNGFSLKLLLGGKTGTLSGVFGLGGIFDGTLPRGLGALHLELGEDGESVTGTITGGATVLEIAAAREVFSGANPSPAAGRFTLALPRDPALTDARAQPYGHGYATLIVDRRGNVRAVGRLGDGSPFSAGGRFTGDETWALFARPYRGRGALLGTMAFHDGAPDFLDGTLAWLKPATNRGLYRAAFNGSINAIGSRYSRPGRGASPFALPAGSALTLDDGGFTAPLEKDAVLNALRFTLDPNQPNPTTLSIDAATGLLRGDFRDANGRKVRLNGVVLPAQRAARGLFFGRASTGALELDPQP